MSKETVIKMLEDMDTDMIKRQGWMLDKMFADKVDKSLDTYQEAMDYAKKLSAQFNVAIRSVTHDESHFMEVYRKKE